MYVWMNDQVLQVFRERSENFDTRRPSNWKGHGMCARIYQVHEIYISDARALSNLYVCMYRWMSRCYRCSEKDPKTLIRGVRAIGKGMACARVYTKCMRYISDERVLSNLYALVNFFTINI